jgi:hypothetical protein
MAVPVVDVIDMPVMFHRLMTAVLTVDVIMARMFDVGEGMFVVVVIVLVMGVTVVDVVDMPLVVHGGVPAVRSVLVVVIVVDTVCAGRHMVSFE